MLDVIDIRIAYLQRQAERQRIERQRIERQERETSLHRFTLSPTARAILLLADAKV